jgi:aspartyl-tRNA(Asn)/glutamyl-tRNA(Gln) amidotransferase subunit A
MIYGKPFAEQTVLRVGAAYERATRWHERRPDLSWIR